MKPPWSPKEDDRRRRRIPWPLHVEIAAILVGVLIVAAVIYRLFGDPYEHFRRIALPLGYEDRYFRNCKAGAIYYLKGHKNLQVAQKEDSQVEHDYDVRLAYDAQDPSGAMVYGEFRCRFWPGSAHGSDSRPKLAEVEVNGTKLSDDQEFQMEYFGIPEILKNRQ